MPRDAEQVYDELLVLRCVEGEEAAFTELVGRWQGRLFGHALGLLGRPDAAVDAVQETWLALVRELPRLRDPASFGGFAHRILARRCADRGRRQARERRLVTRLDVAVASSAPPTAERQSDAARLREALARMPSDRRVLLALHYLHEVPIADIAATLHVPRGTVKSRLHEARAELKRALETRRDPCPSSTT
jgi:RNA polymerase sigma-70 factor (ECF subfamily)